MSESGRWPPTPIRTARLTLRAPEPRDRDTLIDLRASAEVYAYLGGPRERADLDQNEPATPAQPAGLFVIELGATVIGTVELNRRERERHRDHGYPPGQECELSYLVLPSAWGHGYAAEACRAALAWHAQIHPAEPVVLATQVANTQSLRLAERLGFTEVGRFEAWGAQQWFGMRHPTAPADATPPTGPDPTSRPSRA